MQRSGAMRDVAVFEIRSADGDQYGNPDTAWMEYARRHVHVTETPAGEALEGGVVQSHTRATLRLRPDSLLLSLPTDARVQLRGSYWSVVSTARVDAPGFGPVRGQLVITLDKGPAT